MTGRKIDGYDLLVEAICKCARRDLKSVDARKRASARRFYMSQWFTELTGYDGRMVLEKLTEWI